MNAKARTTSMAMAAVLTAWLWALPLGAQTTVVRGHVAYTLAGDHYEVTALDSRADTVVIADDVDGVPVTAIAAQAFDAFRNSQCNLMTHVELGANITTIADEAFYLCGNLRSVVLDDALLTIGDRAFWSCAMLESVTLPRGLQHIGNSAFQDCRQLTSLVVPATVRTIDTSAFFHCNALRSLTIEGDGVSLGVSAFSQCGLADVHFLGTPPVMADGAFRATGTADSPVSYFVPVGLFTDYVALTTGSATDYRWLEGDGFVRLRTSFQGLLYDYVAPIGGTAQPLRVSGLDEASLVNNGTDARPAYLAQGVAALQGFAVGPLSTATDFGTLSRADSIYAIDLRLSAIEGAEVSRTSGRFAGVSPSTVIFLPSGNSSTERNVIIGHEAAAALQAGTRTFSGTDIGSGRATWMLNAHWGAAVFGQQLGTDATPVPLADAATQTVCRATFIGTPDTDHRYRYANTGHTVELPSPLTLGYGEDEAVSYYADDDISKRFTDETPVGEDVDIYVRPQAAQLLLSTDTLTFLMSTAQAERWQQLAATIAPAEAHQEVSWASADESIATVDASGRVTALAPGHTVVTATSMDNGDLVATCRITVVPKPEEVVFGENPVTIYLSALEEPIYQLQWHITPAEAIQDVILASQDTTIATVTPQGLVRGIRPGVTFINATPVDKLGLTALCKVMVRQAADSVWMNRNSLTLLEGEDETLRAIVLPQTAPQQVTWTTSNPDVATVSPTGVVTAVATGVAYVTASADCAPHLTNSCRVTVVGEGVTITANGITYLVTAYTESRKKLSVIHVEDSLLHRPVALKIAEGLTLRNGAVRFDITDVADDAIGPTSNNAYVFIPAGITYNGQADNVIYRRQGEAAHTCHRLVITEGCDFRMVYPFMAETLEYQRSCPGRTHPFTISLPFSVRSSADGIYFFDMKRVEGDTIVFESVSKTEPYKPYLAVSAHHKVDLGGTDVPFPAMTQIMTVIIDDVQLVPVAAVTNPQEAGITNGRLPDGLAWTPFDDDETLMPLTAWLFTRRTTPLYTKLVGEGSSTGIRATTLTPTADDAPIHDLHGRCLGTDATTLPHGIYIRNGKKFVR